MKECIKYVGLDVHKETIAVSIAEAGGGEVRYFGEIANTAGGGGQACQATEVCRYR